MGGALVGIAAAGIAGKIELDDVVLGAGDELGPLVIVDHVVGRGDHVGERRDLGEVIVNGVNWSDLCHGRVTLTSREAAIAPVQFHG